MSCSTNFNGLVGTPASECFEMPILFGLLVKDGIDFDNESIKRQYLTSVNNTPTNGLSGFNTLIKQGDVIPLFEFLNPEDVSVEDTVYEEGTFSLITDKGARKLKAENHLSLCGHKALLRAKDSGFTGFIEVTKDNKLGFIVSKEDSGIDGIIFRPRKISKLMVSNRKFAVKDKPPTTEVTITFKDDSEWVENGVYVPVDYNPFTELTRITVPDFKVDRNNTNLTLTLFKTSCGYVDLNTSAFTARVSETSGTTIPLNVVKTSASIGDMFTITKADGTALSAGAFLEVVQGDVRYKLTV